MATLHYIGMTKGDPLTSVVNGSGAPVSAKPIRLVFDLDETPTREQMANALEHIRDKVLQLTNWPPA